MVYFPINYIYICIYNLSGSISLLLTLCIIYAGPCWLTAEARQGTNRALHLGRLISFSAVLLAHNLAGQCYCYASLMNGCSQCPVLIAMLPV